MERIETLRKEFESDLAEASTAEEIQELQVKYLGRKGPIQGLMRGLQEAKREEKPALGRLINDLKLEVSEALSAAGARFHEREEGERLQKEAIDPTLPGRRRFLGNKHVINQVLDRVIDILVEMGFSVQYGPDIDSDYYNFEALNFPPDHPARDMQDTFYLASDVLLRTHTTNLDVRFMEKHAPPFRIITPGKVYRNETVTARSHVFFHQVDALYVNRGVTFSELLSTLRLFIQKLFASEISYRFRPSYFPFVEPGMEVDVGCLNCEGRGCPVCKQSGWLEVCGAGMLHPEVLKNGGVDPEEYSGYAWGLGIERLVMVMHGINDIRHFTENDMRFLSQFVSS